VLRTSHMHLRFLFIATWFCATSALAQTSSVRTTKALPKPGPFPLQLEMRVPFDPTAFPSGDSVYLYYELHLTNFGPAPIRLDRIELQDADEPSAPVTATFVGEQLRTMLQAVGGPGRDSELEIPAGRRTLVFMCITLDRNAHLPARLFHRLITADTLLEGAVISTHHTELLSLSPPVEGPDWQAEDGPSNDMGNHHRRGVILIAGQAVDSRRFAIDWKQIRNGASFSGDMRDVRSYYCYGKSVRAVGDAKVIVARDGLPENIPGHGDAFHTAIPISLETVAGNTIVLDLDHGQYAHYMHLQPGSLRVKSGDHVRKGQEIARIGASGDAREPHLHFEVTTSGKFAAGEGLPYVIDRYRSKKGPDAALELHTGQLPLNHEIVALEETAPH
jgi:hypothetical protein